MADRQKLIAVCLSQVHSFLNTGFLSELGRAAAENGYGLSVFNSSLDYYWYNNENDAPRSTYRAIQYRLFDAVLIINHSFHDESLTGEIIAGARSNGVPVICLGAVVPGCYSILNNYEDSFKTLLRHVIREHGVKDTFFMAGLKDEPNSEERLRCYREVLEENGLPFRKEQVAYGNYWTKPAADIMQNLIRTREKLPEAIFCANDIMAIAVCDTLRRNGFSVPEDVIVTGFDGAPAAYMVRPHLTTCCDDPAALARQIMELLLKIRSGENPPETLYHSFRPVFAGSCGCPDTDNDRYDALTVYRRSESLNDHENDLYYKVEQMLNRKDSDSFLNILSVSILPGSVIYLNRRFLEVYSGNDYYSDHLDENLLAIPYRENDGDPVFTPCRLSELGPAEDRKTGITVFNAIHTGTVVCGFFAAYTNDLEKDAQLIKRISDVLNLVFAIHLGNARQQILARYLDNTLYLDSVSGLSNLKGLTRWFEGFASGSENHSLAVALSVYSIYRYSYIYETYGMEETEEIVRFVSNRLLSSNPGARIIARISEDQFAVIDCEGDRNALDRKISRSMEDFFRQIESGNSVSSRPYFVEVNSGCTTVEGGWEKLTLESLIRLAVSDLYLNRMRSNGSRAVSKPSASAAELYSAFCLLMEKNLFKFHFQPIVDVKTGRIYAYEALMRTDILINLSPLEVLATAREYNRLYEVERATLFGIMDRFVSGFSRFCGCKLFINTIPGHFLTDEDCEAVKNEFENYLDCFVFELTEQDSVTDDELRRLKGLCRPGSVARIAIDDYGAGHSNIVNVLRYSPQIIKIDKALTSGIDTDANRQLFVRNTVDFAHQNGILARAEGVETSGELQTVISLGVDLVQGFYTGRPAEQPVPAVPDSVRREILEKNRQLVSEGSGTLTLSPADGETVILPAPALQQFSCVRIAGGSVTLTGPEQESAGLVILTEDDSDVCLTLKDVRLASLGEPVIQLGSRSSLVLLIEGSNTLNGDGIQVPPDARLTLRGGGSLEIVSDAGNGVGIGSSFGDSYGTIEIDLDGSLSVRSSGDKAVCIGGGLSKGGSIRLLRGACSLSAIGSTSIGIGSTSGDARIEIRDAVVSVHTEGNDSVGIGAFSGHATVLSSGRLDLEMGCERAASLGSMNGSGEIRLEGGSVSASLRCNAGACIGTFSGEVSVRMRGTQVRVHGEGDRVAGIGGTYGACDTLIESGDVRAEVFAVECLLLGNEQSRVVITGGNVCLPADGKHVPVSPGGLPLACVTPEGNHFEKTFSDRRASWTYTADRNAEGVLCVWVPKAT